MKSTLATRYQSSWEKAFSNKTAAYSDRCLTDFQICASMFTNKEDIAQ